MKEELFSLIEKLILSQYQLSNCVAYEKMVTQIFDKAKEKFIHNESEARLLKNLALDLEALAKIERVKWEKEREVSTNLWTQIDVIVNKMA